MALTEKKKNEILESQKQLAADKLRFKQDVMEKILKNYNLDRINNLKKHKKTLLEDDKESKKK